MAVLSGARDITELSPALQVNNSILAQHGVKLRKSQFSICAAAPGVGKSLFATNIATHARAESLYFSADSDEFTVRQRVLGIITGYPLEQIDQQLNGDSQQTIDYYGSVLDSEVGHVDWAFNADLDIDYIVRRIRAHEAVWDSLPDFIFIDNISDMVTDDNNEFSELKGICRELRKIARATDSHIMALHHVNGHAEDGDKMVKLSDLQGKLGKVPEVVLGLSVNAQVYGQSPSLLLHIAKNRGGRRGIQVDLPVDYSTGFIGGWPR